MKTKEIRSDSVAELSSIGDMTVFSFGNTRLKFSAPYSLRRYVRVKKWHDGYLEVDADYGGSVEEDYIDLKPILRNLMMNSRRFLKSIEKVEVRNVR